MCVFMSVCVCVWRSLCSSIQSCVFSIVYMDFDLTYSLHLFVHTCMYLHLACPSSHLKGIVPHFGNGAYSLFGGETLA